MQQTIRKAGGLFYQYRACRHDANTIYDIENIKNGVIYARSPLYMNDPFDSMIGFSSDKLYQEFCHSMLQLVTDEKSRPLIETVLKHKNLGQIAEFIAMIKDLQVFLKTQRQRMKENNLSLQVFSLKRQNELFRMMPSRLKRKIKNTNMFSGLCYFFADVDLSTITEKSILSMLDMNTLLESISNQFNEIKENTYLPVMEDFLKKITITCFSTSGWDNQLMWSHYAGNYTGICIEYDFNKMDDYIGIVQPVTYSEERPTISFADIGIQFVKKEDSVKVEHTDINIKQFLSYLLVKNKCWSYEEEWRIINIGESDKPITISFPYIKSITMGLHMDKICKHLIIDVCKEKDIPCYSVQLDIERFSLKRELLDPDMINDPQNELDYIEYLADHIKYLSEKINLGEEAEIFNEDTKVFNAQLLLEIISKANDVLFSFYSMKQAVSRYINNIDTEIKRGDIDSLADQAKQVDQIIEMLDFKPAELIKGIKALKANGIVSLWDFKKFDQLLTEYSLLLPKAQNASWGIEKYADN